MPPGRRLPRGTDPPPGKGPLLLPLSLWLSGPVTSGAVPPWRAPGLCSGATQNVAGAPRLSPWGWGLGRFWTSLSPGRLWGSGCAAGPPVVVWARLSEGWRWKDFCPLRPPRLYLIPHQHPTPPPHPRPSSLLMEGVQGQRGKGACFCSLN